VDRLLSPAKYSRQLGPSPQKSYVSHRPIQTLDDLLFAFSHGLKPDLNNPAQKDAFELYRKMRFGNPNTSLNSGTTAEVAKALAAHPELEKMPFRTFKLAVEEKSYPVTAELKKFTDGQVSSAGQVRSNLFQIDANGGFWKKLLQYNEEQIPKTLSKDEQKLLAAEQKARWSEFLNSKITPEVRAQIISEKTPIEDRAEVLYHQLMKERAALVEANKDVRPISQAIADLVHTIGYHDPSIVKRLKGSDGLERLGAYQQLLSARDSFAMKLGYEGHFEQVLKDLGVAIPTGVPSVHGTTDTLKEFEKSVVAGAVTSSKRHSERTIRHLSITESPYRSCLGGSDCSSRTYLTRALDPNYHYFTITDDTGASSGHMTVVLGESQLNGQSVKVGFIDKLQNVPNVDIPLLMEGVRQSLAEKGYKLVLPHDLVLPEEMGVHGGLSNEDITIAFVKNHVNVKSDETLTSFTPHAHKYDFPNKYSRSDKKLPVHEVLPLKTTNGVAIKPAEIVTPWKTGDLDLKKPVEASAKLKDSADVKDRLRYIPSMKAIIGAGLEPDKQFEATLAKWLADSHEPFQLRKQVLLYEWTDKNKPLTGLLANFTKDEQVQLLQNFLDTPRYKEYLTNDKSRLPGLIVVARFNKKVRDNLLESYSRSKTALPLISHVLDAGDISDEKAGMLIPFINKNFEKTVDLPSILKFYKEVTGTIFNTNLQSKLVDVYASSVYSSDKFGRTLSRLLHSRESAERDFAGQLIAKANDSAFAKFPVLRAFEGIQVFRAKGKYADFHQAAKAWMASNEVPAELKYDFLTSNIGSGNAHLYEEYRAALPSQQLESLSRRMDRETNFNVFERLTANNPKLHALLLAKAKMEAFKFHEQKIPEGGKHIKMGSPENEAGRRSNEAMWDVTLAKSYWVQATPVTQLEWVVVTGENPSRFKTGEGAETVVINDKAVSMHPNRPVERVSWTDGQEKFIAKLNEIDPHFNYDLLTETQWENAARAGSTTAYSFGDNPAQLGEHAWQHSNADGQTHDVAELKPNPGGLYDMHGNVSEWSRDRYYQYPAGPAVDPTDLDADPDTDKFYSLRGGSWAHIYPDALRSAHRGWGAPQLRSENVGLRLMRTPK
ncbi:MAG: formylglycine-generating enzyme family protein, partial [Bdellovibrionales bacterium]|nr:formylglycine-generating enzyme family protein [Bdellovibrionales bacterium]